MPNNLSIASEAPLFCASTVHFEEDEFAAVEAQHWNGKVLVWHLYRAISGVFVLDVFAHDVRQCFLVHSCRVSSLICPLVRMTPSSTVACGSAHVHLRCYFHVKMFHVHKLAVSSIHYVSQYLSSAQDAFGQTDLLL